MSDKDTVHTHDNTWFTDLYIGDQVKILELHEKFGIGHPLEYRCATDFLMDVYMNS